MSCIGTGTSRGESRTPSRGVPFSSPSAAWSSRDVWVVGATGSSFLDHWDGDHWSRVRNPNPGGPRGLTWLYDLAATGADDAWAAGFATSHQGRLENDTLVEHWNRQRWTRVRTPNPPGSASAVLIGVAAISSDDALAVGEFSHDSADVADLTEK